MVNNSRSGRLPNNVPGSAGYNPNLSSLPAAVVGYSNKGKTKNGNGKHPTNVPVLGSATLSPSTNPSDPMYCLECINNNK